MSLQGSTTEHKHYAGTYSFVDENGEVMIAAPADTHVVKNKKQIDAYKRHLEHEKGRKEVFTFSDMENIKYVIGKVSDKHCGYLLFLQCFVSYNTIIQNPDKTAMSKLDMMTTLGLNRTAFNDFIRAMISNEIIFVDKDRYSLNPRYHFQGKTKNARVVKSFAAKVKELYGNANASDLGFIYKLLPFIHFETNTICSNPHELDVDKTIALDKGDISNITGITEKSVYSKLRNLKLGDEYVFAEVIHGHQRFYKINPFIFYRKNGIPDATLREIFSLRNNYRKH